MTILTLLAAAALPACGSTITLTGEQGVYQVPRVTCPAGRRLTIDAARATFRAVVVRSAQGVDLRGGTIDADVTKGVAVAIDGSHFIRVAGMKITRGWLGINIVRSTDIEVRRNLIERMMVDGINLSTAQRVVIDGNVIRGSTPQMPTYSAQGKLLKDAMHPDGIQFWSVPGTAPLADIAITNNVLHGSMQGIVNFNRGQGGSDRVRVVGNTVTVAAWHGITLTESRGAIVRDNVVRTVPGARAPNYPHQALKAWLRVDGSSDERVCGNVVPAFPQGQGTRACGSNAPK